MIQLCFLQIFDIDIWRKSTPFLMVKCSAQPSPWSQDNMNAMLEGVTVTGRDGKAERGIKNLQAESSMMASMGIYSIMMHYVYI